MVENNLEAKVVKVSFDQKSQAKVLKIADDKGVNPGEVLSYAIDLLYTIHREKDAAEKANISFGLYVLEGEEYKELHVPFLK